MGGRGDPKESPWRPPGGRESARGVAACHEGVWRGRAAGEPKESSLSPASIVKGNCALVRGSGVGGWKTSGLAESLEHHTTQALQSRSPRSSKKRNETSSYWAGRLLQHSSYFVFL